MLNIAIGPQEGNPGSLQLGSRRLSRMAKVTLEVDEESSV